MTRLWYAEAWSQLYCGGRCSLLRKALFTVMQQMLLETLCYFMSPALLCLLLAWLTLHSRRRIRRRREMFSTSCLLRRRNYAKLCCRRTHRGQEIHRNYQSVSGWIITKTWGELDTWATRSWTSTSRFHSKFIFIVLDLLLLHQSEWQYIWKQCGKVSTTTVL